MTAMMYNRQTVWWIIIIPGHVAQNTLHIMWFTLRVFAKWPWKDREWCRCVVGVSQVVPTLLPLISSSLPVRSWSVWRLWGWKINQPVRGGCNLGPVCLLRLLWSSVRWDLARQLRVAFPVPPQPEIRLYDLHYLLRSNQNRSRRPPFCCWRREPTLWETPRPQSPRPLSFSPRRSGSPGFLASFQAASQRRHCYSAMQCSWTSFSARPTERDNFPSAGMCTYRLYLEAPSVWLRVCHESVEIGRVSIWKKKKRKKKLVVTILEKCKNISSEEILKKKQNPLCSKVAFWIPGK